MTARRVLRRVREELRLSGLAAWRGFVKFINGNDITHAASIAYYSLLSLFPFLLLVMSLLGSVTADDEDRTAVLRFVLQYFPARFDFISNQLDSFRENRVPVGIAGALALTWGSLGVFGAVTSAVNEAWGVEKRRSFWKHRLVSFLMLLTAGGVMLLALLLVSARHVAGASWFGVMLSRFAWLAALQSFALQYLTTLLLIVGVGLVFYFIPNVKTRFRDVWVGAILTGVLWQGAFEGFSWFVGRSGRLEMLHGSISVVVVFLLWVYVSSIILMYGVEFTAAYARLRKLRPRGPQSAPVPAT